MNRHTNNLIVGQGLAGTALAWRLLEAGQSIVVIDSGKTATASKVATGMVTPWSGRRMTQSDDYKKYWFEALKFYRSIESHLSQPLFTEQPMVRVFANRSDEAVYEQRRAELRSGHLERWSGQLQPQGRVYAGCRMQPGGRLDVRRYLQASRDWFGQRGQWYQLDLNLPEGLVVQADQLLVPDLELSADRVIFCQGAAKNPWFEGIPNNPSRGDVINVRLDNYQIADIVHHSVWLVPEKDGSITVGSTYDWKFIENKPTTAGRKEILRAMNRFIEGEVHVNEHKAAVRPTMKDYQSVVGRHANHSELWIFNGLGSRGVLTAPRLSGLLVNSILGLDDAVPQQVRADRLHKRRQERPLTQVAQDEISKVVEAGDVVIDATVGNGFDTCFLARLVGKTGQVYGYDVQEQAISSTQRRLSAAGLMNVNLLLQSHTRIGETVQGSITGAMFNLGYLPRSDHLIVTKAETTISALEQTKARLTDTGRITVLAYRGHDGGREEAGAVEAWLRDQSDCTTNRIDSQPRRETSPVLFVITKRNTNQE